MPDVRPLNVRRVLASTAITLPGKGLTIYKSLLGVDDVGNDIALLTGRSSGTLDALECQISIPALAVGLMANNDTLLINLLSDTDSTIDSGSTYMYSLISAVGAGGVGCAAQSKLFRLPSNRANFYGLSLYHAGSGDPSTAAVTLTLLI